MNRLFSWLSLSGRRWMFLILVAYLLLGIAYLLATPPLEASDEYKHYPFVQYVATTGRLPVLDPENPGRWLQEAAQPPLYYLLMAALTAPIDTSDLAEVHWVNKHAFVGDPNQVANKNLIIHQPERETFPWQGSVLAVYVIRLASLGLGALTILLTGRLGVLITGERTGLLAAALTAFNPMFLFVHAAVNNDSLAILLGTAGILLLVRLWRDVPDLRRDWRRYLVLGVVLGLGLITKLSLGGLLALAGVALLWMSLQKRTWRTLFQGGLLVFAPAFLIALPWFRRNWEQYGDLTGLNVFVAVQDQRLQPLTWADWVGEFGTFYRSFWGLFGGVNVAAPRPVYLLFNFLFLLGMAGLLLYLWRNRASWREMLVGNGLWLLLAWPLLMFLLLLRWNLYSASFQGRLIFPALAAINVLWALGLLAWWPKRWRGRVAGILTAGLALVALLLPIVTIRPVYTPPLPQTQVPADAAFGPISFQDGAETVMELVGVEVPAGQRITGADEPIEVTLYWQAAQSLDQDYLTAVTLLGRGLDPVGQVNRHPAGGMVPTSLWSPGEVWRDVYHVYPAGDAAAPTLLRIRASVYDPQAESDLVATDPAGTELTLLLVGDAVLSTSEPAAAPPRPLPVPFAEGIAFDGYGLDPEPARRGEPLSIALYWSADGTPANDYTVFVHLLNAAGEQVAGADSPPLQADYPTTQWQAGESVVDVHTLVVPETLPAGTYTLSIGLYDPVTGRRLSRTDMDGDAVQWPIEIE
jgi:4-amino-4-deoxy-L-arabinose transferase-like glycosyltransferase